MGLCGDIANQQQRTVKQQQLDKEQQWDKQVLDFL
jgi:hypothetical protein